MTHSPEMNLFGAQFTIKLWQGSVKKNRAFIFTPSQRTFKHPYPQPMVFAKVLMHVQFRYFTEHFV